MQDKEPETAREAKSPSTRRLAYRKATGFWGCFIGVCFGLAGLVASRLGQLWEGFDVFSQFTVQFAVIFIAFLIGWLSPRAKVMVAVVLLIVMLGAISAWPFYATAHPEDYGPLVVGEKSLKLSSYNSWAGNREFTQVEQEITRLDADVITLVELNPAKSVILDRLKKLYPYQARCQTMNHCNFAILSKFPFVSQSEKMLWGGTPYMRISFGPEWGGMNVFAVHSIRFPHSRAQLHQIRALAKELETVSGPIIAMGDFNTTPFSRLNEILQDYASLTRLTWLPSWPARYGLPQLAIDHIFVSKEFRLLQSEKIGNAAGSDHFPISLVVAMKLTQ